MTGRRIRKTSTASTASDTSTQRVRLSLDLETRVRLLDRSGTALSDSAGEDLNRDLSSLPGVSQALAGGESSAAEGELVLPQSRCTRAALWQAPSCSASHCAM